ncbi:MAG TPA: NAD(P)H-dependent oxidoreductase [Thermoanaerobaculia bacterium]|jgi:chromate reductase
MHVLGICGSLRRASYNRALLRAAIELAPEGMSIEIAEIRDVPLYDGDLEAEIGFPEPVLRLREQIRSADALLFATPEYNCGLPGVLKNAIDWVSRGADQPFHDKPAAMMGASLATLGTVRAQVALRQTAVYLNLHFLQRPEVFIGRAQEKVDADGRLYEERSRQQIERLLVALQGWTRRLQRDE